MKYAVIIEKGKKNYGVYLPDVPGCVSVGDTVEECLVNIREALELHFAGMREDGDPLPNPVSLVDYVDVPMSAAISLSRETETSAVRNTGVAIRTKSTRFRHR